RGDNFSRGIHVVAIGIQEKSLVRRNQVALRGMALRYMMFVQRGPRSEIVPAEIGGQTVDVPRLLALRRTRLQHRIVNANVFALWIEPAEGSFELARTERGGDLLQHRRGLRQMLQQRIR